MNPKYNFFIIMCFQILLIIVAELSHADVLHFVNEHWPPYIIFNEKHQTEGIDIEILRLMGDRLKLDLKITQCDWVYCLRMMKNGRADIISSALKRPEREAYLHYIEPPYLLKSTKLLYLPKGQGHRIRTYEDIQNLHIGVLKDSAYFLPFDTDTRIRKTAVRKTEQLLLMLKNSRLDAFIGTEIVADYLIRHGNYDGLFEKSVFRYDTETAFHFAISKKSLFASYLPQFNNAMASLIKEGLIESIIKKYSDN
ncbi:substrate-binding periplasmic protein [Desulfonema magnum]|uniref:ABC transporter, substrate-binding protein n=1 Tax=Desulfonema magnum TaxID=45655 RepID=A0A975BG17_9BACT|nr:transporter substrate-binding domain-containing protein [Desulfonema magnum]QTA84696.1 putative ABC transporter, substrate-binding protein [Desulfonema magnum]